MSTQTPQTIARVEGSYLTPSFEHGRVADAMRPGVISCSPDASMQDVARIMATNHVHAVIVTDVSGDAPWGIVTDRDVVATAHEAADRTAGSCVRPEPVTINPGETLYAAADMMQRHGVTHLVVAHPARTMPLGVLSTLDLIGVVAWGRG